MHTCICMTRSEMYLDSPCKCMARIYLKIYDQWGKQILRDCKKSLQTCRLCALRKISGLQVCGVWSKYDKPFQESLVFGISVTIWSIWRHVHFIDTWAPCLTQMKPLSQALAGLWHTLTTKHMLTSFFGSGSCFEIFYMCEDHGVSNQLKPSS